MKQFNERNIIGMESGSKTELKPEELDQLEELTYFSRQELKMWHEEFMLDCPSGELSFEDLEEVYEDLFPAGDSSKFVAFVFNLFDKRKKGSIAFSHFVHILSITTRGTLDDKLDWAFLLYDADKDGFITKKEMLDGVDAMYSMIAPMLELPKDQNTPEKRVENMFLTMDKNHEDRLTREEFKAGAKADPQIAQAVTSGIISL